ncbi:hypothetical protein, partial [Pantoea dispersa]|uniref:hypothetical protein n=1 Tax=Pantoea dispersa TaxID=59814 RepID=UPI0021C7DCA6
LNTKTNIINGSKVSRLSVAIHLLKMRYLAIKQLNNFHATDGTDTASSKITQGKYKGFLVNRMS